MSLRELARAFLEKATVPQMSQRDTIDVSQWDKRAESLEYPGQEGVSLLVRHGTAEGDRSHGVRGTLGTNETPRTLGTDGMHAAVIIDIADHLARAQRIADRKNAEAARRRHTDRWCRCGDYASGAWRVAGREIWRCEACETEGA